MKKLLVAALLVVPLALAAQSTPSTSPPVTPPAPVLNPAQAQLINTLVDQAIAAGILHVPAGMSTQDVETTTRVLFASYLSVLMKLGSSPQPAPSPSPSPSPSPTPSPSACSLPVAPATINVCLPQAGENSASPIAMSASMSDPNGVLAMAVYSDPGVLVIKEPIPDNTPPLPTSMTLSTEAQLSPGTHQVTFQYWDSTGKVVKSPVIPITVQ